MSTECKECGSTETSVMPHSESENVKCIACGARYQDDEAKPRASEIFSLESEEEEEKQSALSDFV